MKGNIYFSKTSGHFKGSTEEYSSFLIACRKILKWIWNTTVYTKTGRVGKAEDQQKKTEKELYAYNDGGNDGKRCTGHVGRGGAE